MGECFSSQYTKEALYGCVYLPFFSVLSYGPVTSKKRLDTPAITSVLDNLIPKTVFENFGLLGNVQ